MANAGMRWPGYEGRGARSSFPESGGAGRLVRVLPDGLRSRARGLRARPAGKTQDSDGENRIERDFLCI